MAVVVGVRSGHVQMNSADSATGWSNWGSSGPAPAAEAQLAYQNTNAVNKKITSASLQGIQYGHGSQIDLTAANKALLLLKVIVADSFDVDATRGLIVAFGNDASNYRAIVLAGSAAKNNSYLKYTPSQGGYVIVAIDPDIVFWHDGVVTAGSVTYTQIDWIGTQCAMINGLAKAENLAMDSIEIGTGLFLNTNSGSVGKYQDFVDWDQDTRANRPGFVSQMFGPIFVRGMLMVGRDSGATAVATLFTTDLTTTVIYPDMPVSAGLIGTTFDLGHASTVVNLTNTQISRGGLYNSGALDTRADIVFVGTAGVATVSATLTNLRRLTLTSVVEVVGASVECERLIQDSAHVHASTIRTKALTNVACIQDPVFGGSDLHDVEFVQTGAGHAVMINTPGTYAFTDLFFSGYGGTPGSNPTPSSGAADAAVYNNSGGAVTINVSGGDTPSVRNAASSTTTVNNTVNYDLTGIVDNSEVTIVKTSDSSVLFNVENTSGGSISYGHDGTTVAVDVLVFHVDYEPVAFSDTLGSSNQSQVVQQVADLVYKNP